MTLRVRDSSGTSEARSAEADGANSPTPRTCAGARQKKTPQYSQKAISKR